MASLILLFDLLSPSFTSCVIKMENDNPFFVFSAKLLLFRKNLYSEQFFYICHDLLGRTDIFFIRKMGENADKVSMMTLLSAYSSTCCFYCLKLTSPTYLQCQGDQIGSLSFLFSGNRQTLDM
jgi:hypothetical protein